MNKRVATLALLAFIVLAIGVAWLLPRLARDPLCRAVNEAGFECLPAFQSEAALHPGTLITADGARGSLTDSACLLPGATISNLSPRLELAAPITAGFSVLSGAATLAARWPAGTHATQNASAWSNVHEVVFESPTVTKKLLDNDTLRKVLGSCEVAPACSAALANQGTRVVIATLVSERSGYRFVADDGRLISSLSLERTRPLQGNGIHYRGRGIESSVPQVLGVLYADSHLIDSVTPCTADVAYVASAESNVMVKGGRGPGAMPERRARSSLGQSAIAAANGTERSDCGLAADLSRAYAQADVREVDAGTLRMTGEARAVSGRFHQGRCATAKRREATGLLTTDAHAELSIEAEIAVLARRNGPQMLSVNWEGAPVGSDLKLLDPTGAAMFEHTVESDITERLELVGPGVFRLRANVVTRVDRLGEAGSQSHPFSAELQAHLAPPDND